MENVKVHSVFCKQTRNTLVLEGKMVKYPQSEHIFLFFFNGTVFITSTLYSLPVKSLFFKNNLRTIFTCSSSLVPDLTLGLRDTLQLAPDSWRALPRSNASKQITSATKITFAQTEITTVSKSSRQNGAVNVINPFAE